VTPADLDVAVEFGRDPESVFVAAFTSKSPTDRVAFDAHWTRLLADAKVRARTIVADGVAVGSVVSFVLHGRRDVAFWIGRARRFLGLDDLRKTPHANGDGRAAPRGAARIRRPVSVRRADRRSRRRLHGRRRDRSRASPSRSNRTA
jgi:hypothetical protein